MLKELIGNKLAIWLKIIFFHLSSWLYGGDGSLINFVLKLLFENG